MIDYYNALRNVVSTGEYNLEDMEDRIDRCWIDTKITMDQRDELRQLAAQNAKDEYQVDLLEMYREHDARIYNLEHPTDIYPIWTPGRITLKGEIVRYDVTADGELDLCQFDGGNPKTSLSIGKINGWFLLDRELNRTHTIMLNADKTYTLTPIDEEPSE